MVCDVLDNFLVLAFLVRLGPIFEQVVVVRCAVFQLPQEVGVAEKHFLGRHKSQWLVLLGVCLYL